eukprot:TRINITY_DN8986_c0_g1_i1.p1 TRINITY_DN8986_c0_g1~~TRINITY_DN8986_c0_g1_i1.p1  ORF type:complete len:307 (-),score=96.27 TRINITY_DN8986_c0_g1_i1:252-1172(-)
MNAFPTLSCWLLLSIVSLSCCAQYPQLWGWTNDFKSTNNTLVSLSTSNFQTLRNLTFVDASRVMSSAYDIDGGRLFFVSRVGSACLFWEFETSTLEFVGYIAMNVCVVEMHYDPLNDTIWAVTMSQPTLGRVNVTTAVFEPLVTLPGVFPAKDSSAFDVGGQRYFITVLSANQDLLLVYDVRTGRLLNQLANGSPTDFMQGLQYDVATDTLVGITSGSWSLVLMNSRSGARTVLRTTLPAPAAQYTAALDAAGRLYHVQLGSSSTNVYNWATFNISTNAMLIFDKSPHLYWHMHLQPNTDSYTASG